MADTPDTTGFVTTELFDYNELINTNFMHAATVTVNSPNPWPPGNPNTHSETWTAKGDFQFISWNYYRNPQNSIGMPANRNDYSTYRATTLSRGIYTNNTSAINRLFDNSSFVGKTVVGEGNYLFRYNETTGYYYYDSDINAATYNQNDGRFYVYQNKEYIDDGNGNNLTNFLPFNDYPGGSSVAQNTGATNYWFGMKNTINFSLPDDVGTTNANKIDDQDMVFKFSGDDDVWVLVD